MMTVQEVSRLTGVSVRTLHHYDAIGLLKPAKVTGAGYRLYDDAALSRLHSILLFRELQFPLKEIGEILDDPKYDPSAALERQIELLELQRKRLGELIEHARALNKKGECNMSFKAFDKSELEQYKAEAKAKWGKTEAYQEFETKTANQTKAQMQSSADALMDIFREFGEIRHLSAASCEAQALVKKLQNFITEHYYTCTNQILFGLGQMYAAEGEMNENIDKAGGEGTGAFARDAIIHYCK